LVYKGVTLIIQKGIVSIKDKMAHIRTSADALLELLVAEKSNSMPLNKLAKKLGTDAATAERWAGFLADYVSIEYPTNIISKPYAKLLKKPPEPAKDVKPPGKEIDTYFTSADNVSAEISISREDKDLVPFYCISLPSMGVATEALLKSLANELTKKVPITVEDISDQRRMAKLKEVFSKEGQSLVEKEFAADIKKNPKLKDTLAGILLHNCYGLGEIELLISDDFLEEICINSSNANLGVYHIKHGWLKTNISIPSEKEVFNIASQIARKSGTNITNLEPLMDAHLVTGDRANSTLFPISSFGNTITIRKFARVPWTISNLVKPGVSTISTEIAALLWLCMQYELNILVTGGTASGKTSMLNAICSLIPSNQRIISIEDTREINLPGYLHWNWIPMATRNPNQEGKGEVSMLDLIANSLRMRPDRIVMGEVRRRKEAEVLFEAMHTGHSVYSTVHADTSRHLVRRMTKPPFELPLEDVQAIDLIVVQFRDRRRGFRRTLEIAEILQSEGSDQLNLNYLYRWSPRLDKFEKVNESKRLFEKLNLYTGMTSEDIKKDLKEKQLVLDWMIKEGVYEIDEVGAIVSEYYTDKDALLKKISPAKK
jgi:archaeal flagellar protein FlaI